MIEMWASVCNREYMDMMLVPTIVCWEGSLRASALKAAEDALPLYLPEQVPRISVSVRISEGVSVRISAGRYLLVASFGSCDTGLYVLSIYPWEQLAMTWEHPGTTALAMTWKYPPSNSL